jgi:hypothetical protein
MRLSILLMVIVLICFIANGRVSVDSSGKVKKDFSTPQGSVLCLEDAYRSRNIPNILECRDFDLEAIYMLKYQLKRPNYASDKRIVKKVSADLRTAFIKELHEIGIPNIDDVVNSKFYLVEVVDDSFLVIGEVCTYTDGGKSAQKLVVGESQKGWRMIVPIK